MRKRKSCGVILEQKLQRCNLSVLQYADDTVISMDDSIEEAKNMKLIFTTFEQLSGLKINYHKSELYCFGDAKQEQDNYMGIFRCQVAETPFTYLGIYRFIISESVTKTGK